MKIKLKLYGTLGNAIPEHDPLKGMEIEIPDGSSLDDLIDHLAIPKKNVGLISVDGSLAKAGNPLRSGNFVRIFRPVFGG
jgi:sulfur carrier protein ThiS